MTGDNDTDGLGSEGISRRTFVKATGAGLSASGAVFATAQSAAVHKDTRVRRYGTLGRTGISISDISFGSSRLRTGEENLVRHALDRGVNYFDTADSYTRGQSETVIGNALKGDRNRVAVVTKTKVWADDDRQSIMRTLEESLRKLKTDYVDVYFNHAVNETDRLDNPEWQEFAEMAKKQGKIRFTGLSGHAGRLVDVIDHAVDGDLVDVLLVSYNFGQDPAFYESITRSFDRIATQSGLPAALARAKARNMGIVAMKTLMGGRLNDMRPFETDGGTYAQAAFRWTLSNPNVDGLIVSMTGIEQIDEYLGASGDQTVSARDLGLLKQYAALNGTSYCRQACNDCAGACPYGVPIADVLRTRMYAVDYEDLAFARDEYAALEGNASACLSCTGEPCRSACSHGLDIAAWCAPTHRMLA
jgi:predicted aldo/keto reductase-like oxidoreductase